MLTLGIHSQYQRIIILAQAACHKTKNRAFITPTAHDSPANRAAIKICQQCPMRRECAERALTSGDTLQSGYSAPAVGVIQAGVLCRGDITTALELALIAGVAVPDYSERGRARAAEYCRHCEQPMVPWTRDRVPDGYRMHYAANFCTECRTAYREYREQNPNNTRELRKTADRRAQSAAASDSAQKNDPITQLTLFG